MISDGMKSDVGTNDSKIKIHLNKNNYKFKKDADKHS